MNFKFEQLKTMEEVRKHIQEDEGKIKYGFGMNPNSRNGFKRGNTIGKCNKGRVRLDFKGERNPRWNGGKGITTQGYIEVIPPKNYSFNKRGRILEHRLVMEKHLGRKLLRTEHIHHKNGNKRDNKIENLKLLTNSEHKKEHKLSKESKNKISLAMKGKVFSKEHKLNLSKSAMGNTNGKRK